MVKTIYKDDQLRVTHHLGSQIGIKVGDSAPTIVDAAELNVALSRFLRSEASDGD